jgi:ketosteroid isomerase-like protein
MSDENVEVCRRLLEATDPVDFQALVGLVEEYADPEVEFHSAIVSRAEGSPYRGLGGIREWANQAEAAFALQRVVAEEFQELGDEVLVLGSVFAVGRESGAGIESPVAFRVEFRGGRIVRIMGYLDHVEALQAAGLAD